MEKEDIKLLANWTYVMLLHADITDSKDWNTISYYLKMIKTKNSLPGLATHTSIPYY